MINFGDFTKENMKKKKHNPNWPQIFCIIYAKY